LRMDTKNGVWGGLPVQHARYVEAPNAFPELALNYQIRAPSILFRRDRVERVGGFDRRPVTLVGEWHADWHPSLRLALVSGLAFHPESLAYHRTHTTNLSGAPGLTLNNLALLKDVFDHLPDACRRYDSLRGEAYRAAADRLYPSVMRLRGGADEAEFADAISEIKKYLPDYTPPKAAPIRGAILGGAVAAIKLLTYRKLSIA